MQVIGLIALTFVGMGLVAALAAALYPALPHSFLECAELHGRFQGLRSDESPTGSLPAGLSAQAA